VVEVRRVSHAFGTRRVLDGVDLAVRPGEVVALLGPNGAGKTTVLRLAAGLLVPVEGEVRVLGGDPTEEAVRAGIGWIPAGERSFYLRLSAVENLVFFARLQGIGRREARRRAEAVLEVVGLAGRGRDRVRTFSQGMQRRLSVARGLLHDPAVLLVDEATHDLDPEGAEQVRAVVRAAADSGAAVLWATQRIEEVRDFADWVVLLAGGRTRFSGSVSELLAHADRRRYVLRLAGHDGPGRIERLRAALGPMGTVVPDGADGTVVVHLGRDAVLGRAIAALAAAGVDVVACHEQRSEVEEAFRHIVEGAQR
jgi:ABC-2 type transport system ATP-binding protein